MTGAMQGCGPYGPGFGGYGYGGYGYGGYGHGGLGHGIHGVRHGSHYPPYTAGYAGYSSYPGYASHPHSGSAYGYGHSRGHGCSTSSYHGRYANFLYPLQSSMYYGTGGVPYHYGHPGATTTTTVVGVRAKPQYAYVHAAVTPTTLPAAYAAEKCSAKFLTADDILTEKRRIATESGAYRPRKIKPADARPDDKFWCREINGEWTLRKFYDIESLHGLWQMDAEGGFLVFHCD